MQPNLVGIHKTHDLPTAASVHASSSSNREGGKSSSCIAADGMTEEYNRHARPQNTITKHVAEERINEASFGVG